MDGKDHPLDAQGGHQFRYRLGVFLHPPREGRLFTAAKAGKIRGDGEIFFSRGGEQPAEGRARGAPAVQKYHGGITGVVFSVISAVDLNATEGKAIHKKTPL